ncbi:MAG: Peptidyl-tRNA hydrolase [Candidatus Moranbacteria bacterium GW2011_GWE1_36_7]|nr:MAG: Peptidyl-tRNA hydrolase [Candidatus Moranbacteria bacterium GW2011_GWD2_36_12]KKQ06885.1 MAG: Peptidyl-tRNA hydrolase [Candidatus Moranbacteria bacterium GW2011_GWE2_36_40]KKQ14746.1 MAG: Peptidyl-tRNA hydrolase [Candidatus Moranbacteria bacterium GW2011_GWE1_36_7]
MKLLVGLGNPTKEYENTRHNAGFIVLDEIRKEFSFPEFKSSKKFEAEISEGIIKGRNGIKGINGENAGKMIDGKEEEKIILVKPQTFMNLSGKSIGAIMAFYKIPASDLIVLHDDLDIELGTFKISTDSSAAGHNGVTSIFETLGTQKIKRIRIGIEGAEKKLERLIPGSDFVLQNFSNEELETVQKLSKEIVKNI